MSQSNHEFMLIMHGKIQELEARINVLEDNLNRLSLGIDEQYDVIVKYIELLIDGHNNHGEKIEELEEVFIDERENQHALNKDMTLAIDELEFKVEAEAQIHKYKIVLDSLSKR